jgi:hypothetical protein
MGSDVGQNADPILMEISESLRVDANDLLVAQQLSSRLETDIRQLLEPTGDTMKKIVDHLDRFEKVLVVANTMPDDVPCPVKCGIAGESTLRARFGLKFLAQQCTVLILQRLRDIHTQSSETCLIAKRMESQWRELVDCMRGCADGILTTLKNCRSLQAGLGLSPRPKLRHLREKLDLTTFSKCVHRLSRMPDDLEPMLSKLNKQINAIQEFKYAAVKEVEAAFFAAIPLVISPRLPHR